MAASQRVRVALVGVHGYGDIHLQNICRLVDEGRIEFVAAADSVPPEPDSYAATTRMYASLGELLAAAAPDIVVLATPIHTHAALAQEALMAGAHVYVEKPPLASMGEFRDLEAAAARCERAVQVGFQAAASHALTATEQLMVSGDIGAIRSITTTGTWTRPRSYFTRSRWAGKRVLDGVDVVDGAVTNPFAHAVQTTLALAGATRADDVAAVTTDLYRANDIESDDTSVVRVRVRSDGPAITCAFTLCAETSEDPYVTVYGSTGTANLYYTLDQLSVETSSGGPASRTTRDYGRDDLLENLVDHVSDGAALISPLEETGGFMRVVEAVRQAPEPEPIGAGHTHRGETGQWTGAGTDSRVVVDGVDTLVRRAGGAGVTFAELGAPWARRPDDAVDLGSEPPIVRRSGESLPKELSPRPFLHPVKTARGTVVTDALPTDHPWHLGANVGIQDVDGVNFWGGRTYRPDAGYVWRHDHGRIVTIRSEHAAGSLIEELSWLAPDAAGDRELIRENRRWSWKTIDGGWMLELEFALTPGTGVASKGVQLGSPGSNGRAGGGYGGFFWRMAPCTDIEVRTEAAGGTDAVHGAVAPSLTWSAAFGSKPVTLVFRSNDGDPWFVRTDDYPGVGLSLAWTTPVVTTAEAPVRRSVRVEIRDA